ncbi:1,4-alpha-glucan branching protein GlgB [Desulfovibrio ferrophilus]|uniref:1,4-alpha-glucan branching enzyme GlgB n=1 Tax=Desulfovibrio ferrophilus TaxID=241368 RepID=A0A2Z6B3E7_9BACT|nr:1,4-alpha-glucan branching protein GlgB [Desulfovibrio ferrophilus]BBD09946.1 glycogen branching protein [Desulfovibrio ferrophilus]
MQQAEQIVHGVSLLTDHDIYLFKEGRHYRLYNKLGAHLLVHEGVAGTLFALWAPNAQAVSVCGDFNGWAKNAHPLYARHDGSGIWEGFVPGVLQGAQYKYHIDSRRNSYSVDKADPFAFLNEGAPRTASVVWDLAYEWGDSQWMEQRSGRNAREAPWSVYEMHLGSWRRDHDDDFRSLHYSQLAEQLPAYVRDLGFTHVELMPVMEHPFFGSWGYQTTGYFAPTSRLGPPQDFMRLVENLHREGVGVILDWVPSHFPTDEHGLSYFDGTHLFEHEDPRKGYHPDWNSSIFNHARYEVRSFLISSALFWLDRYHADGLRVDAVASMLYLDYSREEGEWEPNEYGGRENIGAIEFLRGLNEGVYAEFPDVQTVAEESTAWPMVSRPVYLGGLGFGMKWNMGWMNDTLSYFSKDPIFRKFHQNKLTFSIWYAFTENFMLPLSHDEVVHGKGSLYGRMPGDPWRKCAGLKALYGYMFAHPGKNLLFMGAEMGQVPEWNHDAEVEWHLLDVPLHKGVFDFIAALNRTYREHPALYADDFSPEGFEWVDFRDVDAGILAFLRKAHGEPPVLAVCNFTPVPRENYLVGVPAAGYWREILNSDALEYGGSGWGNFGGQSSCPVSAHGHDHSLALQIPPLSVSYFLYGGDG